MPLRSVCLLVAVAAALLLPAASAQAGLPVYVVESAGPTVSAIDSGTGARSVITTGGLLAVPTGIAIEADGSLVVSDAGAAAVVRIDPDTGGQTTVSSSADLNAPSGIAVQPDGRLLVTDQNTGGILGLLFTAGALTRVDQSTGATTTLTSDDRFGEPTSVAVAADGDMLVADPEGPAAAGSVIRVNGTSFLQTNGAQGGSFVDPWGVAIERSGTWLLADPRGTSSGAVHRTASAGTPEVLASGGELVDPRGIAIERSGNALVADPGADKLVRVAGTDGTQTVVASALADPVAVAVPVDEDDDGVADLHDNCPVTNTDQTDTDVDGAGNACDNDDDGDGVSDAAEATAGTNPLLPDTDGDAVGDGTDNCPVAFNVGQADADGDGTGDACDATPNLPADPSQGARARGDGAASTAPPEAFDQRVAAPVAAVDEEPTPQPVMGKTVAAAAFTGRVTVRVPGSGADVPLTEGGEIPVGAVVDTTSGAIVLTSALPGGRVQSARFSGGRFAVTQRGADGITDLRLAGDGPVCPPRAAKHGKVRVLARAAADKQAKPSTSKRRTKRLWGDGHGKFRTHGREAVATVRGTKWLVEETCTGTLVRVARGVVSVRDKRSGKTSLLRRGERRLVRR
jgi:streptogramin lyase